MRFSGRINRCPDSVGSAGASDLIHMLLISTVDLEIWTEERLNLTDPVAGNDKKRRFNVSHWKTQKHLLFHIFSFVIKHIGLGILNCDRCQTSPISQSDRSWSRKGSIDRMASGRHSLKLAWSVQGGSAVPPSQLVLHSGF